VIRVTGSHARAPPCGAWPGRWVGVRGCEGSSPCPKVRCAAGDPVSGGCGIAPAALGSAPTSGAAIECEALAARTAGAFHETVSDAASCRPARAAWRALALRGRGGLRCWAMVHRAYAYQVPVSSMGVQMRIGTSHLGRGLRGGSPGALGGSTGLSGRGDLTGTSGHPSGLTLHWESSGEAYGANKLYSILVDTL